MEKSRENFRDELLDGYVCDASTVVFIGITEKGKNNFTSLPWSMTVILGLNQPAKIVYPKSGFAS